MPPKKSQQRPPPTARKRVSHLIDNLCRLPARAWHELSQLTFLSMLLVLSIPVMLCFILYSVFIKTHLWIFSVHANAGVVELVTPPNREFRWRINGATICSRDNLAFDKTKMVLKQLNSDICGKRWHAYQADPAQELVLIIKGSLKALLEVREDHNVYLALHSVKSRSKDEDGEAEHTQTAGTDMPVLTPGARLSFNNGADDLPLGNDNRLRANFIIPETYTQSGITQSERIFPFSGDITVGRDINWAGTSLLDAGKIQVYVADESPDRRSKIDETDLMLGDQLRLDPVERDEQPVYPKGFAHLDQETNRFDIVAFGDADRVRIERFGDNGYNFRPGILSLLIHDPWFIWVTGCYAGIITAITGIAGVCRKKKCD